MFWNFPCGKDSLISQGMGIGLKFYDVNMDAYTTQQFTDIEMDLGDFTFFKVFLWSDLTTAYAPLADYIEY